MKKALTKVFEYVMVGLAGVLNAVSVSIFVNPNHLVPGGFTGLASVIFYLTDESIGMSLLYFITNIPLLISSIILLRGDFTFKTIFASVVCSVTIALLPKVPGTELSLLSFTKAPIIAVMFGGVLIGTSMYVASVYNGSNGGTEIIARIVNKYHPEVDLSKVILVGNVAIQVIGSVLLVIRGETVWLIPCSLIYSVVGANLMGMLERGFNHPQKFLIITTKHQEICNEVLDKFKRGVTIMNVANVDGTDSDKKMLLIVVQYRQSPRMKYIIRKHDDSAFTIVKDVHDVFSRPLFNRSYTK